ncbi:hypothetical protein NC651_038087 [Populus alba x Populus x berolinensis]|nr:hypothetical protein NC651_038087 [Populus alba x Populus x berolinensis]
MGVDVTHPCPLDDINPSDAYVVGSLNWPAANKDGVSETQNYKVLKEELQAIREAFSRFPGYRPPISFATSLHLYSNNKISWTTQDSETSNSTWVTAERASIAPRQFLDRDEKGLVRCAAGETVNDGGWLEPARLLDFLPFHQMSEIKKIIFMSLILESGIQASMGDPDNLVWMASMGDPDNLVWMVKHDKWMASPLQMLKQRIMLDPLADSCLEYLNPGFKY